MPELLKNMYSEELLRKLAMNFKAAYQPFQADDFLSDVMDETWDKLELKARMRQITVNLRRHLPDDYEQAIGIINQVVADFPHGLNGFVFMCFPDFVEVYGQEERHWDVSIAALERYTMISSSEFAVRPFIINHEERMMRQMAEWALHEDENVRRLASEGCRPSLPWAQALPSFKKDPTPVLRVLELLKADPSLYVRKSVANNLNDISKTHPELVAEIAKAWYGKNGHTDWIVKHGCRTLLKKGNRDALSIFGMADADSVEIHGFTLGAVPVFIGMDLLFSFQVEAKRAAKVRLEYGVDYVKANGGRNRKMFQISELAFQENTKKAYTRKHSFADVSTRKHYPGTHSVTLIVNGAERGTLDFEVLPAELHK